MTYTPNFSDPRVKKRIKSALGFSLACIGSKPTRWAKSALNKPVAFGHSGNDVSKWLKQVLLITTDDHYSMDDHIPKEYVLRPAGVIYLKQVLTGDTKLGWDEWLNQKAGLKAGVNEWDNKLTKKVGQGQVETTSLNQLLLPAPAPSVMQQCITSRRPWTRFPIDFPNDMKMAFKAQRNSADNRGIGWNLTPQEWLNIWQTSGHLNSRGTGSSDYCMARLDDAGTYEVGNIVIVTNADNIRSFHQAHRIKNGTNTFGTVPTGAKTDIQEPIVSTNRLPDQLFDCQLVDEWADREFGEELRSLAFTYEDKSSRLWHPLQNVRRQHKKRLLHASGLQYSYDIVCAAPTLLLRYAQSLPDIPERNIWTMDLWLFAYQSYLKDRTARRAALADLLQVDVSYAKTVLNSLFCGAKVGAGPHFSLFRLLGTYDRIQSLKDDKFITALRADIKVVWNYIEPTMMRIEKKDKKGRQRKVPLNSKRKWGLYFDLERKVLDVVRHYLEDTGNPHFLEHDGWSTRDKVDVAKLRAYIYDKTGFAINIDEAQ